MMAGPESPCPTLSAPRSKTGTGAATLYMVVQRVGLAGRPEGGRARRSRAAGPRSATRRLMGSTGIEAMAVTLFVGLVEGVERAPDRALPGDVQGMGLTPVAEIETGIRADAGAPIPSPAMAARPSWPKYAGQPRSPGAGRG